MSKVCVWPLVVKTDDDHSLDRFIDCFSTLVVLQPSIQVGASQVMRIRLPQEG